MASYDSPLGKKKFNNQQPTKEYVVDEPDYDHPPKHYNVNADSLQALQARPMPTEEDQAAMEADIQRARQEKRTGKQRLDPGAKKRLEVLLGMTRTEREVEIAPETIVLLQTLSSQQLNDVISASRKETVQFDFDFQMRRNTLARSIKYVANNKFEDFIGSNDLDDKLYFIDEFDDFVLTKLYKEYGLMTKEAQEKYGIQTEAQQKEVAEEIKK